MVRSLHGHFLADFELDLRILELESLALGTGGLKRRGHERDLYDLHVYSEQAVDCLLLMVVGL